MRQNINNTPQDSGLGDTLFVAFNKVNDMTLELYNQDTSFINELQIIQSILLTINDGSTLNHQHLISNIIGLQTSLNSKVSTTTFNSQIAAINATIQQINNTINTIIDNFDEKRQVKIVVGTTYTLVEEDKNKILNFTSNTDVTITIPSGLTSTNRYEGKQLGTGQLIFGIHIGGNLRVGPSEVAKTAEQYSVFGLDVIGVEEYMLYGKLELS